MTNPDDNKVLVTGANGQLGWEVSRLLSERSIPFVALTRQDLDIADAKAVESRLRIEKPVAIINAAAYTAVDKAEQEPEAVDQINHIGALNLAKSANEIGTRLIHISTDYVFSGDASIPYSPQSEVNPLGCYGKTKAAGELAVKKFCPNSVILRTAWVYSAHGNNFVKTMLRLMNDRDSLGVVADQIGTPTWAKHLAEACVDFALSKRKIQQAEVHHWTDLGVASWYDFAVAIYEQGKQLGLVSSDCSINPIATTDYPTPARRPYYSLLDKRSALEALGIKGQYWADSLSDMLKDLKEQYSEQD